MKSDKRATLALKTTLSPEVFEAKFSTKLPLHKLKTMSYLKPTLQSHRRSVIGESYTPDVKVWN